MGVHQHPAVEQLDQGRVGPGIQVPPEILLRRGVERPGDLDVEVAVHLHPGQDRHVIGRVRQRQQLPGLGGGEHLGRAGLDRARDTRPAASLLRLADDRLRTARVQTCTVGAKVARMQAAVPDALTINEAAATTGWTARMLRYIERIGLVDARAHLGLPAVRPAELQRLRTLRELLDRFESG